MRVLVVEDHPRLAETVATVLRREGMAVDDVCRAMVTDGRPSRGLMLTAAGQAIDLPGGHDRPGVHDGEVDPAPGSPHRDPGASARNAVAERVVDEVRNEPLDQPPVARDRRGLERSIDVDAPSGRFPASTSGCRDPASASTRTNRLGWGRDAERRDLSGGDPIAHEPSLIIQVPRDGVVQRQLSERPPSGAAGGEVVVEAGQTDPEGNLEAAATGEVVLSVPSPEALAREPDEVRRVIAQAGTGVEPLVVVIEAAEELREEELMPVLAATAHTSRPVIVRVIRDA